VFYLPPLANRNNAFLAPKKALFFKFVLVSLTPNNFNKIEQSIASPEMLNTCKSVRFEGNTISGIVIFANAETLPVKLAHWGKRSPIVRDGRDVGAVAGTLIVDVIVVVTVTTSSVDVAEVVFPAALRTVITGSADVVLAVVEAAMVGATVSRTVTTGSTVVVKVTMTTAAVASALSAETASAVVVGVATS
jgi:hypothetical protein